jgi:hypothetical protein
MAKEICSPTITKTKLHPTEVGRQACCGFHQSMPGSFTAPSAGSATESGRAPTFSRTAS